jgi:tetratricopeptide (TPR) repeat protein
MHRSIILATALTAALAFFGARAILSDDSPPSGQAGLTPTTASRIASLEQRVADRPNDVAEHVNLAAAYLQMAKDSADPSYYGLSDAEVQRALALAPDDVYALVMAGTLEASKHHFGAALVYGERARELEPSFIASYSVIVDALVEMGRYDEATLAAQQRANLRPDFAALSRISYLRELHGDLDGAIVAMERAVAVGTGSKSDAVWGLVLVGDLYLTKGDIEGAALAYQRADALLPGNPLSQFGLAKLAIARDDYPEAERLLRLATAQAAVPEHLTVLGDLLSVQGRSTEAEEQYARVHEIEQRYSANGEDTGLEIALFDAEHDDGDPQETYADALAVYGRGRQSVAAADTVAWAAYKAGHLDEAQSFMRLALRLGTQDPRLSYHAGVIAQATGDESAARQHFEAAVRMEAGQSLLYIDAARDALSLVWGSTTVRS